MRVHSGRAESLTVHFDCVTLRAVDKMAQAVRGAGQLVRLGGWLAPMTTTSDLPELQVAAGASYVWLDPTPLPGAKRRILAQARKQA